MAGNVLGTMKTVHGEYWAQLLAQSDEWYAEDISYHKTETDFKHDALE